jgi:hypothetical protein
MAAITWANVLEVAISAADIAALTAVPVAAQTAILTWVNGNGVATDVFDGEDGDDTRLARQYMAAHIATLTATKEAPAGPLVSESEGAISRSYQGMAASSELERTTFGSMFRMMARINACGAWLA